MVDGITPHKCLLFKRGMNVVTEVILPHFWVRPFCVVVSSSLWNRRSWVRISELELTRHSALQYFEKTYQGVQELAQNSPNRAHPRSAELLHLPLHPPPPPPKIELCGVCQRQTTGAITSTFDIPLEFPSAHSFPCKNLISDLDLQQNMSCCIVN